MDQIKCYFMKISQMNKKDNYRAPNYVITHRYVPGFNGEYQERNLIQFAVFPRLISHNNCHNPN